MEECALFASDGSLTEVQASLQTRNFTIETWAKAQRVSLRVHKSALLLPKCFWNASLRQRDSDHKQLKNMGFKLTASCSDNKSKSFLDHVKKALTPFSRSLFILHLRALVLKIQLGILSSI